MTIARLRLVLVLVFVARQFVDLLIIFVTSSIFSTGMVDYE